MSELSKFKVADAFKHLDANHGLMDDISSGFSSIRYRGKAWTLQYAGAAYPFRRDDDGTPLSYIDLIILGISPGKSKVYFGNQDEWNEDSSSGPICASLKGDVPDPGVPVPQSKTCGICPNNDWITKPGGGRGKACQDHKRMAVLLLPAMTKKMLKAPLLEPVYLKIPPGSFKSLKSFCDALTHEGIPFSSVVTRISFAPNKLFEMEFKVIQALTNAEAPLVLPMIEAPATKQIVGGQLTVIRDDEPELAPPPKKKVERVDTGLMGAFTGIDEAKPQPPGDGQQVIAINQRKPRPKKAAAAVEPDPQLDTKVDPPNEMDPAADEAGTIAPNYQESDVDLDDTVARLLSNKMSSMMK